MLVGQATSNFMQPTIGVAFAGSSALFQMSRAQGKPKLLDMMTKEEEGLRVWDIDLYPSNSL